MTTMDALFHWFGIMTVASPVVLLFVLGVATLLGIRLSERVIASITQASGVIGLVSAAIVLALMLWMDTRFVPIELGNWVSIEQQHFHFKLKFIFDRLSVPFALLSFVLCGVVGAFTQRYLHRETGYQRFFLMFALFLAGMVVSSLAGTIETLFLGWEMVGLSSALLIAYHVERQNPVRNGQRVWAVYRLADAAFLLGAIALHHLTGEGDFASMTGQGAWPDAEAAISGPPAVLVGVLLLIAAAGKSGLVPFSGWLPRAMEGPTPSSAVFYGALSVHLGAYLLLRISPILHASLALTIAVVLLGTITAACAVAMSRVQSDVKSSLAYASLTQVGIIVVEIGLGLHYLALIHIIGHAALRTLQLLRAPTLLKDYQTLENALGDRVASDRPSHSPSPSAIKQWAYRFGFDRGFMDTCLDRFVVSPYVAAFRWADRAERRWTDWLSGESRSAEETD